MPLPVHRRRLRALLSPWGGTVAAALGLLIFLGCLSVGVTDNHSSPETGRTYRQEGHLLLGPHEERDVYYPEPYVSPPYLELNVGTREYELTAQQPTHFRVRNVSTSNCTVTWEARGVRGKVTQTITPGLPPAPVPVDAPPQPLGTER